MPYLQTQEHIPTISGHAKKMISMQNVLIYFVVALSGIVIETHMIACWKGEAVLNIAILNMYIWLA